MREPDVASAASAFSHHDHRPLDESAELWRALRERGSVSWSTAHGGYHVVSGYAEICAAAREPGLFSSAAGTIPPLPLRLLPVHSDPPEHREYRRILNPWFTPRKIAELEPVVRASAIELLEQLEHLAEFEFCEAFAIPFPQRVALSVIGFPVEERAEIASWVETMVRLRLSDPERVAAAGEQVRRRVQALIAERRAAERGSGGIVDALLDGDIAGRPLAEEELVSIITLLLFGGLDTTTSALAGTMYYLARHPDDWRTLRDRPDLLSSAVDEFVRFVSPVQGNARTALQDTELGGCPIKAGDRVFLAWASGNRDEAFFSDAEQVVFDRRPNRHLGFGMGPHRCVGWRLGKMMLDVAVGEMLDRLESVRIADEELVQWVGGETHGIRFLPLVR